MQTNYTEEEAEQHLKDNEYNYVKVIKEYLNPNPVEKKKKVRSVNEKMMDEIRNFMDDANRKYIQRKEEQEYKTNMQKEIYKKFLEEKKNHPNCVFNPPTTTSCSQNCSNPMCPGLLSKDNKYIKSNNTTV